MFFVGKMNGSRIGERIRAVVVAGPREAVVQLLATGVFRVPDGKPVQANEHAAGRESFTDQLKAAANVGGRVVAERGALDRKSVV